jgi:hypothetical protein
MPGPERLFSIVNLLALLSWVALALLPGKRWVARWIAGMAVPTVLAVVYAALILSNWGGPGSFSSLDGVALLFANPWLLLAGWIHYLAFDLLVGAWEVRDARERGVPHLWVVPCLFLTFMFGPAGWLAYQGVRRVTARVGS